MKEGEGCKEAIALEGPHVMSTSEERGRRNFSTPLIVEAMEGNLAAYIMYCSCIPGAQVQQEADHISALTGILQPSLNVVMRTRFKEDDAYGRIAEIMEPFKARQVPHALVDLPRHTAS